MLRTTTAADVTRCENSTCDNADPRYFIEPSTAQLNYQLNDCWLPGSICLRCGTVQRSGGVEFASNALLPTPTAPTEDLRILRLLQQQPAAAAADAAASERNGDDRDGAPTPAAAAAADITPVAKPFKNTYQRKAHLMERLSASCCLEPIIPTEDYDLIDAAYQQHCRTNYFAALRARAGLVGKKDVQLVLRIVDEQLHRRALETLRNTPEKLAKLEDLTSLPMTHPFEADLHRQWRADDLRKHYQQEMDDAQAVLTDKGFALRYLEKWKSIKQHLLGAGTQLPCMDFPEMVRVGHRLQMYSSLWDLLQPAVHKRQPAQERRGVWQFVERKHFPNINFMTHMVLDELVEEDIFTQAVARRIKRDFPLPHASTIRNVRRYYAFMRERLFKFRGPRDATKKTDEQRRLEQFLTGAGGEAPAIPASAPRKRQRESADGGGGGVKSPARKRQTKLYQYFLNA